jgi:DNA-binding transcriptional regulator GbsR (MarR family)
MAAKISKVENEFIDKTGNIAKQWGLGEPAGRVWGAMLFSETALSQRSISEKTKYSLSLVSPSLKILIKLNLIRSIRGEGREKLYEMSKSFIESFNIILKRFLKEDIQPLIAQLESIKQEDSNKKLIKLISEYKQLNQYLGWFEKMIFMKKITGEKINELLK